MLFLVWAAMRLRPRLFREDTEDGGTPAGQARAIATTDS